MKRKSNLFYSRLPVLAIFLLWLIANLVFAQENDLQYFPIRNIQANEVIKGISQDTTGYIWLATDQGVVQYDGNETHLYYSQLPSPFTKKFLKRKNGDFLVLTDFGVKKIIHQSDTTIFENLLIKGRSFSEPLIYPKSIFEDSNGNIWIGEINSVVKINENGFIRFDLGEDFRSINYHRSFTFAEDAFGHVWIAPYHGKLLFYNTQSNSLDIADPLADISEITSMVSRKGDDLILGGREGLLELRIDSDHQVLDRSFNKSVENISSAKVFDSTLFVGTWTNGLYSMKEDFNSNTLKKVEQVPFPDILDFYIDPEHQALWVAGSENIGLLKRPSIQSYNFSNSGIEAMETGYNDLLYFSIGQEIYQWSVDDKNTPEQLFISKETYYNQIKKRDHFLYIGNSFGGITKYDLLKKSVTVIVDDLPEEQGYHQIYLDFQNNIWLTNSILGLTLIDPNDKVKKLNNVPAPAFIAEDSTQNLYCFTNFPDSLIYRFDADEKKFLPLKCSLNTEEELAIQDVLYLGKNAFWIATQKGIFEVEIQGMEFSMHHVNIGGLNVEEPIRSLTKIHDQIWAASPQGLQLMKDQNVTILGKENGLPSRLIKNQGLKAKNDNLFIATSKGLAKMSLNDLMIPPTPVPTLKTIHINGQKYSSSDRQKIKIPSDSRIQFDFVSLSFPQNNMVYQTRIPELDTTWTAPSGNGNLALLGISPGNYTIQIRAQDNGLSWSKIKNISFEVLSPWYSTWWAVLLFMLIAGVTIWFVFRLYRIQLIGRKSKFQKLVEARTSNINHEKSKIKMERDRLVNERNEILHEHQKTLQAHKAQSESEINFLKIKEKQLTDQLEYRNKQITVHSLNIIQKNEMLQKVKSQLEQAGKSALGSTAELKKSIKLIDESFRMDKDWEDFQLYFEQIFTGFYSKLKMIHPDLTNQDLRHCALIRLNLNNNECASVLGISPSSIKVTRNRLRKKLQLSADQKLSDFILSI